MAEASVDNLVVVEKRYYCHQCNSEFTRQSLPDFLCPNCSSGFIEELPEMEDSMDFDSSDIRSPFDFESHIHSRDPFGILYSHSRGMEGGSDAPGRGFRHVGPRVLHMTHSSDGQQQNAMLGENPLDQFFHQLFSNLGVTAIMERDGGGGVMTFNRIFHQNMGDYVWGPNGLDNIISQLLNQLEGSGPPPADKENIDKLPKIQISQEDVDNELECAVCKDSFVLHEQVLKLSCNHKFHSDCVKPWLQLHDSCPVCRCSLSGQPTDNYS
ncbi:E3 ubiquitin-protein ligase RNF126-like [Rhopilema esculentum]|uniref:E3 ubiquitin-protein ligase RNF126-like n=1 Tax=Rhopilema esculentum TaxID=499914 RepID=UPI0031D19FB0